MKERWYGLDATRAFLLLLGIPYHYAAVSLSLPNPLFNKIRISIPFSIFLSWSHSFRMFSFFMLSGFFSAMMIKKNSRNEWISDRFWRLGIPFIVALPLLGQLQYFLKRYYFGDTPSGLVGLPIELDHLWFLIVLLIYCLLVYMAFPVGGVMTTHLRKWQSNEYQFFLLLLLMLSLWGVSKSIVDRGLTHAFPPSAFSVPIDVLLRAITYLPAFAIGMAMYSDIEIFLISKKNYWLAVSFLIVFFPIYFVVDPTSRIALGLSTNRTILEKFIRSLLFLPIGFCMFVVIVKLALRVFKRNYRTLGFFAKSSFGIYMFHFLWVLVTLRYLRSFNLTPALEWIIGSTTVLALSVISYKICRRYEVLALIFCGARLKVHS